MTVALITGAARGIGAATARRFAGLGWNTCLVDSCADDPTLGYPLATRSELDAIAAVCGSSTITHVADVRDADGLQSAVDQTVATFGGLDVVVAAAGAIAGGPSAWETDQAIWSAMIDVNLAGVFNLARAAIPAMLDRPEPRSGRFVAVASAAAHVGLPQLAAYTAAKHGVAGLVKALAAELGPHGVTANAVSPGSTETAMLDASATIYDLDGPQVFAEQARIGRLLDPDEIAAAIAFLCSAEAAAITGTILPVDGGFSG